MKGANANIWRVFVGAGVLSVFDKIVEKYNN
jgi:hypothetical protein